MWQSQLQRRVWWAAAAALWTMGLGSFAQAPAAVDRPAAKRDAAKMETYTAPDGTTSFALMLSPEIAQPKLAPHDVVVLFDTSASQTGSYRVQALEALEALLAGLNTADRVSLLAVDLNAVPLTPKFVAARGREMNAALKELRQRVPLGSTDMMAALKEADQTLGEANDAGRARSIVYVGDGMSVARLLQSEDMQRLTDELVASRIAVSSFAVGPRVDLELLGSLAGNTGGMVIQDQEALQAQQAGAELAHAADGAVVWPTKVELPSVCHGVYSRGLPPLRFDRDTVLLGTLDGDAVGKPLEIQLTAEVGGAQQHLSWQISPSPPLEDNAYLGKLVEAASRDGGMSMPVLGTAEMADLRRLIGYSAESLARLGQQALATGQVDQAEKLVDEASRLDPLNEQASLLRDAVARLRSGDTRLKPVGLNLQGPPPTDAGGGLGGGAGGDLDSEGGDAGDLIDDVERKERVQEGALRATVRAAVNAAHNQMGSDPQQAVEGLKLVLEQVKQAPGVRPEVRAQLISQIEAAMRAASQQVLVKTERDTERMQREAEYEAEAQLNRELFLKEEKLDQLMARFGSLMDEERYRDAEAVASLAEEMSPNIPGLRTAELTARMTGWSRTILAVRDARFRGLVETTLAVETSHIPVSDEPPIYYPPAEVWQALTERRKKWKAVDLTRPNSTEAKIANELEAKTDIDFVDTPLTDVLEYLKTKHDIEIQLDKKALDDAGVAEDTPITRNLHGISLRSALRLILSEFDLTYVIKNEVLMITTKSEAENMLVTKVYPVGDLVIPPSPFGLGAGMGGGGGRGGGMGMM